MASVINGSQVKLNSGQTIQAQQGGWYDGQQFWGGSLSNPGQINSQSNQQGAGQQVSNDVIAQTNPANVAYIQQQQQQQQQQQAPQPKQASSSGGGSSGGGGTGVDAAGAFNQPEINLPQLYEQLYSGSGIRDTEADLNAKTMARNEAIAKIKDNPYLSEATMTGRIAKIEEKFSADSQAVQNQISMKKADIETQLNLQTKQFDIESNQAKLAWDQFNNLLSSGALDNASGEDIAQITRATGISSSMVQSAIGESKKKNAPKVSIDKFDDGTNVYAVAIDEQGNVVNRQIIGASEPSKTGGGTGGDFKPGSAGALSSGISEMTSKVTSRLNSYGDISPKDWQAALSAWLSAGFKKEDFVKNFGQYADTNRGDFASAYGFANPVKKK